MSAIDESPIFAPSDETHSETAQWPIRDEVFQELDTEWADEDAEWADEDDGEWDEDGFAPVWTLDEEDEATSQFSSSRLEWPGKSGEELAFMRKVYDRQVAKSSGFSTFTADLPDAVPVPAEGSHRAHPEAAEAIAALLKSARAQLAADGLADRVRIGIVSAYRPASEQFIIWQGKGRAGGFPYYREMVEQGRLRGGDFGSEAVEKMAARMSQVIAAPGYSNHQDGLAFDLGVGDRRKGGLGKIGTRSWFHKWLIKKDSPDGPTNAGRFGFAPLATEPWHWTYRAAGGSEAWSEEAVTHAISAGEMEVTKVPLLSAHRGSSPDLILGWNDMPAMPEAIDVVVHLHGYWYPKRRLLDVIKPVSGLALAPEGVAERRTRPVLTILPRGHDTGVTQKWKQKDGTYKYGYNKFTFPKIVSKDGLAELIRFALDRFAKQVGGSPPRVARLILTAHSGGGAALLKILEHTDPHQVHVFDALYQDADMLAKWARRRIERDREALQSPGTPTADDYLRAQGGALRVFYQGRVRGGTRPYSLKLRDQLVPQLGSELQRCYRIEASNYDHFAIPRNYGWRMLVDAAADVPEAYIEPGGRQTREVQEGPDSGAPAGDWEAGESDEEQYSPEGWSGESEDFEDDLAEQVGGDADEQLIDQAGPSQYDPSFDDLIGTGQIFLAGDEEDRVPMTLPPPQPPKPDPQQEKCRQKWEAAHDKLPQAVQQALAERKYPLAVGLAIHSGVRDANRLTDMVFMSEYGPRRGYCRLSAKEQTYVLLWRDINKTMVAPRLAVPSPPIPQAGGIACVAHKDRRFAGPAPDNPGIDVTGRYEFRSTGVTPAFTFRINQAGKHVEAVLTTVILPRGTVNRRDVHRYHGDLQADGSFLLFNRTKPDMRVVLRRDPQSGTVSLDTSALQGGKVDQLDVAGSGPTLMENALDYLPVTNAIVKHHEWFPLTRLQIRHLIDGLSPNNIEPYLKRYFDTPADDLVADKIALRKAARPFDDYLNKVFNDDMVGVHYLDRPLALAYARTMLSETRWKRHLTRSHLDWIQIMLSMVARGDHKNDFQGIQTHLGLRPDAGPSDPTTPLHTYKVTLKLRGGGIFVQGYTGTITFEKTGGTPWPASDAWPDGKASFGITIGGLSSGVDISLGSALEGDIDGIASTSQAWQPPDIPGTTSMVKGGISIPGLGADAGFLHIYGSEIFPPMAVTFTDVGFKIPTEKPKGRIDFIPKPDLGGFWGKIHSKSFPDIDYTTIQVKSDHAVDSGLTQDVHFCLDGAILTEDARQALRIMCANELAAFMSPASRLTINGHTDRIDTPVRNMELSNMRVQNTYLAIKDILGARLAIDPANTVLSGKGETDAIRDNRPDGEINPNYRRVDVILNGRLVLVLGAK